MRWDTGPSTLDQLHGIPAHVTHTAAGERITRHVYGRQTAQGSIVFGGDRVRTSPTDYASDPLSVAANQRHIYSLCPALASLEVDGSWSGLMPFSSDGKPLVGELAKVGYPGLFLADGLGAGGIIMGPALARLLALAMTDPTATSTATAASSCSSGVTPEKAGSHAGSRPEPHRPSAKSKAQVATWVLMSVDPCREGGVVGLRK